MNAKTAKLLRKQCIDTKGDIDKKEARILKRLWNALPKSLKIARRLKFKAKAN
jgi:hypothetical protein